MSEAGVGAGAEGGGRCRRVQEEQHVPLLQLQGRCQRVQEEQLVPLLQLDLHRRLVEDRVVVGARAVQVDDVQVEDTHDGVAHLVHSLRGVRGSLDDFSEDIGAYRGDFFSSLRGACVLFLFNRIMLYCAQLSKRGVIKLIWLGLKGETDYL